MPMGEESGLRRAGDPLAPPLPITSSRDREILACVGCQYDLAGLTPPGRCPECGKDLLDSLSPTPLRGWSRAQLEDIRRGLRWASALPVAAGVCVGATCALTAVPGAAMNGGVVWLAIAAILVAGILGSMCGWAAVLQPHRAPRFDPGPWPKLTIASGGGAIIAMGGVIVCSLMAPAGSGGIWLAVMVVAFCLLSSAHLALGMLGLAKLARAMQQRRWSAWAAVLALGSFAPTIALFGSWVMLGTMFAGLADFDNPPPPRSALAQTIDSLAATAACLGLPLSFAVAVAWAGLVYEMRHVMGAALGAESAGPGTHGSTAGQAP
jgi:hypothetical protein